VLNFHDPDASGSVPLRLSHRYLYGPSVDMILADERLTKPGMPDQVLCALADHPVPIRDVANSSGGAPNHLVCSAYGQTLHEANNGVTFTRRERDYETADLYYDRAHHYATTEGGFFSKDPIGFAAGDANLYRSADARPTNAPDRSGMGPRGRRGPM
jgi:RHS repeat-associated protein